MIYPTVLMINLDDIGTALTFLNNDPKCDSIMSATTFLINTKSSLYRKMDMLKCLNQIITKQDLKILLKFITMLVNFMFLNPKLLDMENTSN